MEPLITLECPSCGGRSRFATDSEVFTCEYCGNQHVFNVPRQMPQRRPASGEEGARNRPSMPRPNNVSLRKRGQNLELTWRWFSFKFIPLAFFCIAWDSFLCFWYGMALKMLSSGSFAWIMVVFPIAHVAVGVGLTYATLAGFLNTSTLRVDGQYFILHHDPLPWSGELKLPVSELEQIYCQLKHKSGENESTTYTLSAALKDGRKIELLKDLDSPDIGVFMEQQLERWLNIPDRPMVGEALA
jgi:hypothetical protein